MNLTEPIIPGESAAGIALGDEIRSIILETKPNRIQQTMVVDVFHFDDVIIWSGADRETVNQIAVTGSYRGSVDEHLVIGMPLSEAVANMGQIAIGGFDELYFEGIEGLGIEAVGEVGSETISHILVYPRRSEQGADRKPDNVPS